VLIKLATLLLAASTALVSGQTSPPQNAKGATKAKPDEFHEARIKFAQLLQDIYKKEGRFITVKATGEDQRTLELFSALIDEGTHTLEAARRETINSEYSMAIIRRSRFKEILIHSERYSERYVVK